MVWAELWQGIKSVGTGLLSSRAIQIGLGALGVGTAIYITAKGLGWGEPTLSIGGAQGLQIRVSWIMWIVLGIILIVLLWKLLTR